MALNPELEMRRPSNSKPKLPVPNRNYPTPHFMIISGIILLTRIFARIACLCLIISIALQP